MDQFNDLEYLQEIEEIIQHHGVKGMKWGVVRKKIANAGRAYNRKLNSKREARDSKMEKRHTTSMKNPLYKSSYTIHRGKGFGHKNAMRNANREMSAFKLMATGAAMQLGAPVLAKATVRGSKFVGVAYRTAIKPENIRRGKNIVQAIKRSPVRYVDGKTLKNVVDMTMPLVRR